MSPTCRYCATSLFSRVSHEVTAPSKRAVDVSREILLPLLKLLDTRYSHLVNPLMMLTVLPPETWSSIFQLLLPETILDLRHVYKPISAYILEEYNCFSQLLPRDQRRLRDQDQDICRFQEFSVYRKNAKAIRGSATHTNVLQDLEDVCASIWTIGVWSPYTE